MAVFRIRGLIAEENAPRIINNNSPKAIPVIDQKANILSRLTPLSILRLVGFDMLISRPFHGDSFEYKSGCLHTFEVPRAKNGDENRESAGLKEAEGRKTKRTILIFISSRIVTANRGGRPCGIFFYSSSFGLPLGARFLVFPS